MPIQPTLQMRYTTSSPTTTVQTVPRNSTGGYSSVNEVFPSGSLQEWINSTQSYIQIHANNLPEKIGVASVGPEVIRYGDIDTSNNQLLMVTRNIDNLLSSPAGKNEYNIFEKVYYLHKDADLNISRLFDIPTDKNLVQYRCIAIIHTGPVGYNIDNVQLSILQDPNSKTQFDFGIEVPRYDSQQGTQTELASTSIIIDPSFSIWPNNYFNNELIYLPNLSKYAVINSFSDSTFNVTQIGSPDVITPGQTFVVLPGHSQIKSNCRDKPESNNGLFAGFSADGASSYVVLENHAHSLNAYDVFYVWLKQTVESDAKQGEDSGAILTIMYDDVLVPIQGKIFDSTTEHLPIAGVQVVGSGLTIPDGSYQTYSDSNGDYVLAVKNGWNGTVSPSLNPGTTSTPENRTYYSITTGRIDQNFTEEPQYTVEGYVNTILHGPLVGSEVVAIGTCLGYTVGGSHITEGDGHYIISLPGEWSGYLTIPTQSEYVTPPDGKIYINNLSGNLTGQNFTVNEFGGP